MFVNYLNDIIMNNKSSDDNGSISPTYLRTAFTPVAPKSVRVQSSCQYLFTLLESTGAKAASRTLMKLTHCGRFSFISGVFVHFLLFHIYLFTFVDIRETIEEKCHPPRYHFCDLAILIIILMLFWIKSRR